MKKVSKSALLFSTALLWWVEGGHSAFAADLKKDVDFAGLTVQGLPGHAKGSEKLLFEYLDTLKNGSNDSIIEGAKKAYNNPAKIGHLLKMKAAIDYLNTAQVARELSQEERELTKRTEAVHQQTVQELAATKKHVAEAEQDKNLAQEALGHVQGFTKPEDVKQFLENFKEAMSGFSDGLFLRKFKGDEEPEFEAILTKIAKQAEASAELKKDYESDKRIKKLDIFLQLPSNPIDLGSINNNFKKEQGQLSANLEKKIKEFSTLVETVKADFEAIPKKNNLHVTQSDIEYFEEYWLNAEKGEIEEYKRIFQSAEELIKFYQEIVSLLNKPYKTPTDFKKEYDVLLQKNKGILTEDFSGVIGGEILKGNFIGAPKTEAPKFLTLNRSGLSLYHYLRLRKAHVSEELEKYITTLMDNLKKMRIEAYQLKSQLGQPKEDFMKFDDSDPDLKLDPKMMVGLQEYINQYEKSLGENALQKNIKQFLSRANNSYTDFNIMKDHKEANFDLEQSILASMRNLTREWTKFLDEKDRFYRSKALRGIFASDLYAHKDKNKLVSEIGNAGADRIKKSSAMTAYDTYLSRLVKITFKKLEDDSKKVDFNLLFDEPVSVKEARKKKNEKIEDENRKLEHGSEKIKLEEDPPLTLEIINVGILMRHALDKNNNLSFDDFWRQELQGGINDIAQFEKALSQPKSKEDVKKVCGKTFEFLKSNTEDQRQLYNLFNRVIEAKKHHDDFMGKMQHVKHSFEPLKAAPKHAKPEIQKKVGQLTMLLQEKFDAYLKKDPADRSVNYAYNFPMFCEEALKPLDKDDKKMKIWGEIDETAFDKALKEAYEAYLKARDAIRAINPTATEDKIGAVRLGGFYDTGVHQIHQPAQLNKGAPPALGQGGGGPPPPPPPALGQGGGGPPPPPPPALGQRGGALPGAIKAVPEEEQIIDVCNKGKERIIQVMRAQEGVINQEISKIFDELYKKFIEAVPQLQNDRQAEIEEKKKEKKQSIIKSVTSKVTEEILHQLINNLIHTFEYDHIDKGRPDLSTIISSINNLCTEQKIKESFDKIFEGKMSALKITEKTNAEQLEKRKEGPKGGEGAAKHGGLKAAGQQQKVEPQAQGNAFGQQNLKKAKTVENSKKLFNKVEQAELEVVKIQPTGADEASMKQADKERLEKIKEFLKEEKGEEFAKGFADAELLAFPLWAIHNLKSTDLEDLKEGFEVEHHKHRKFSLGVLNIIKGVRFNKNEIQRQKGEFLTADTVKGEGARQLLGTTLQISRQIILDLVGSNEIK